MRMASSLTVRGDCLAATMGVAGDIAAIPFCCSSSTFSSSSIALVVLLVVVTVVSLLPSRLDSCSTRIPLSSLLLLLVEEEEKDVDDDDEEEGQLETTAKIASRDGRSIDLQL